MIQNSVAIARHQDSGNSAAVANAMVGRAILLSEMGLYEWSNSVHRQALCSLPSDAYRGRVSALNGLAHNHTEQGDTASAIAFLAEAEDLPVDALSAAKLSWASGAIFSKVGRYPEALEKLTWAQQSLRDLAPVDAVLVAIDKCETFLLAGQFSEACQEARTMLQFLEPLRARTPLAEAAAVELAVAGQRGEGLTLAALEAARGRVKAKPLRQSHKVRY